MPNIRGDASVYIWLALGLLSLPLSWQMGALLAAICHELGHFTVARLLKVHISGITVSTGGAVMHMAPMDRVTEFLVTIAGPVVSLLLGMLIFVFPELAVCGIVQGVFNLIPLYPLDGGRMLRCLLGNRAEKTEIVTITTILTIAVLLGIRYGLYPLLFGILVTGKAIQRKFPCKE